MPDLVSGSAGDDPVVERSILPPERCEECGFASGSITAENAATGIRRIGQRYRPPLTRLLAGEDADNVLRHRPDPSTWSALEYAAHVRDVIALWSYMLHRALSEDGPALARPDPDIADRTAKESTYNELDPVTVVSEIAANADRMAAKIDTIGSIGWDRAIALGDERFTSLAIVQKVAHEGHHHLLDIGRVLRAVRGR